MKSISCLDKLGNKSQLAALRSASHGRSHKVCWSLLSEVTQILLSWRPMSWATVSCRWISVPSPTLRACQCLLELWQALLSAANCDLLPNLSKQDMLFVMKVVLKIIYCWFEYFWKAIYLGKSIIILILRIKTNYCNIPVTGVYISVTSLTICIGTHTHTHTQYAL